MSLQSQGKSTKETRSDNTESARARVDLLRNILEKPGRYLEDEGFKKSLSSQGGLAKLCINSLGIMPMSLNTLKARADDPCDSIIDGGWDALDKLRKGVVRALNKKRKAEESSKQTKAGLEDLVKEKKQENARLWDEVALITLMFDHAMGLAKELSENSSDATDKAKFQKRQREIMAMAAISERDQRI